ncbi:flavodoxin family protein [Microbacterium sp. JZ31]|uniref:flavodoxin family protein n=1 Tax=Microbacterium sp. JZ31 TaxID=1906274 RepID=UPI0019329228|nr:NAD(P)H-dependent oxidoreductase [Microbacterium sp. JZ31]
MHALAFNCTLTPSPDASSTELLNGQVLEALAGYGITGEQIRVVDHDVKPGVLDDMGNGDAWPALRQKVLDADILVFGTPTWMGHMSSIAQRVLERLDNELSVTDDAGRQILAGKVAVTVVVGNEDGAHGITADLYQALVDAGYTVPSQGGVYWNGEAMKTTDYKDLEETPEQVASTTATLARNAAHLARLLKESPYPPPPPSE